MAIHWVPHLAQELLALLRRQGVLMRCGPWVRRRALGLRACGCATGSAIAVQGKVKAKCRGRLGTRPAEGVCHGLGKSARYVRWHTFV